MLFAQQVQGRPRTAQIYLHSAQSEFAQTQALPEHAYLGTAFRTPSTLRLLGCGCGNSEFVRVPRSPWMRLLPLLRQYSCVACGTRVLRPRTRQRHSYGPVYILARPLRCEGHKLGAILAGTLRRVSFHHPGPRGS